MMETMREPVHPGSVFLQDVLAPLGLSITQAAQMLGITRRTLSEFVHERSACSPKMALRIAEVTKTSPESWLMMQAKVDLWKARQYPPAVVREFPRLAV